MSVAASSSIRIFYSRLVIFLAVLTICSHNIYISLHPRDNDNTVKETRLIDFMLIHPTSQLSPNLEATSARTSTRKRQDYKNKNTTCIVVGMMSRSSEFRLRQWQRKNFRQATKIHPSLLDESKRVNVRVQLRFSIAYNTANSSSSIMEHVYKEQDEHGDIFLLNIKENYKWLVGNMFEMLQQAVNLMVEDEECSTKFIVKADSDVLISYATLIPVVLAMPSTSTYFGKMQPNTPTHDLTTRTAGSFAYSFFPVWAVGGLYGMSADIATILLRSEVERTVLKRDLGYMFPEEDRSVGLALARSQTKVRHRFFLKGLYFFCPIETFNCERYGQSIAFNVGFGLSGDGNVKMDRKLSMLRKIQSIREKCRPDPIYQVEDQFFLIDDEESFLNSTSQHWLMDGCASLNKEGRTLYNEYTKNSVAASLELNGGDARTDFGCAETMYRAAHPDVDQLIQSGVFSSARDHYLKQGHRSSEMHYFCPQNCDTLGNRTRCTTCDNKATMMYLQQQQGKPDVKEAVDAGVFSSGLAQNKTSGLAKGRSPYSCYRRFEEEGWGDAKGCLATFSRFINATSNTVSKWPVTGQTREEIDPDTCKALLLIEGRDREVMDYVLRVHRRYTGPEWMFYLIGPPPVAAKWREKYSGPMVTIIDLPQRFGNISSKDPDELNALYRSRYLWDEIVQCEYVLVTQTDALLLRHGAEDFFEYAYVGSPVYPDSLPTTDWRYLCTRNKQCGGTGGLSFRRRSECQLALESCKIPQEVYDEDVWYSACLAEMGKRQLPHPTIANRFSTGSKCQADNPFGVHKLWEHCKESTCAVSLMNSQLYRDIFDDKNSHRKCKEGEINYLTQYKDVARSLHGSSSAWDHYQMHGKINNREYKCLNLLEKARPKADPFDLPALVRTMKYKDQKSGWFVW